MAPDPKRLLVVPREGLTNGSVTAHLRLSEFTQPVAILRYKSLFDRLQWEPPDRWREYQRARLREVLEHARQQVPWYSDRCGPPIGSLSKSLKDTDPFEILSRLPCLTRSAVRGAFHAGPGGLWSEDRRRYAPMEVSTSGTSGQLLRFLLDRRTFALEFAHYWRHWGWAGYRLGDRFAEFSFSHFLYGGSGTDQKEHLLQRLAGRLVLNSVYLDPNRVKAHAERIRRHAARFIKGAPSTLAAFCRLCSDQGIRLPGIRAVFAQGDVFFPAQRKVIESFFDCKAYDSYGQMERVGAITECPSGRLHIDPEYGYLECIDEKIFDPDPTTASPVDPPIEGAFPARLVGTTLHNRSMPFLKYDLGDRVWLDRSPKPCPCGRSFPTVRRIDGRAEDLLKGIDGRVVAAAYLGMDGIEGVRGVQIIQDAADHLHLRVLAEKCVDRDAVRIRLQDRVVRILGPGTRIDIEWFEDEAQWRGSKTKFRMVVNEFRKHSS